MSYALLIDGNPLRTELYAQLLAVHGMASLAVRDGALALAELSQRGAPDLVVTELALEDQDGFAFLSQLKKRVSCPVLAITGFPAMLEAALPRRVQLGLMGVVRSDLPPSVLATCLRSALDRRTVEPARADVLPLRSLDPARLAAMAAMRLVDDGPPDEVLQSLCAEVARSLGAEQAMVSLILEDRQWFKAYAGVRVEKPADRSTPLAETFCRHVVDGQAPMLVPDAAKHPVFDALPVVAKGAVRGYAGVPLQTSKGLVLGSLCVVDSQPIQAGAAELNHLRQVARRVAGELELMTARKPSQPRPDVEAEGSLAAFAAALDVAVRISDTSRQVLHVNEALAKLVGLSTVQLLAQTDAEWIAHMHSLVASPAEFDEQTSVFPSGPFAGRERVRLERPAARRVTWVAKPLALASRVVQLEFFEPA